MEELDTADIERLARWLDGRYRIPGTNIRFGYDSLIGLAPGVGDTITGALGLYIIARAHRLGAPRHLIARMLGNVAIDSLIGAIPILGDLFDVVYKSNSANIKMLLKHLESERARPLRNVTRR
ncbi:Bll7046 protein [alpha proteobacterium U9-1i]|nr:Bll7046 protein [alpha proteobacterium U9-1i]